MEPHAPPALLPVLRTEVAIEEEIHRRVNLHRASIGLPPLVLDTLLADVARRHSRAMAGGRPYGHHGFERRVRLVAESISGAARLGENVAANNRPDGEAADHTVRRWIASGGHRANIEGDFGRSGVGVVRDVRGVLYYTHLFLAVEGDPTPPLIAVAKPERE